LEDNIATVLNEENDIATDDIASKLEELQIELLRLANTKADYSKVAEEIYRLRELKQNTLAQSAERQGKRQRIEKMAEFLDRQPCDLQDFDERLVRKLVEKVTVFDDKLTTNLKSCMEINIGIQDQDTNGRHLGPGLSGLIDINILVSIERFVFN
jgi:site-specific DNA recombinase